MVQIAQAPQDAAHSNQPSPGHARGKKRGRNTSTIGPGDASQAGAAPVAAGSGGAPEDSAGDTAGLLPSSQKRLNFDRPLKRAKKDAVGQHPASDSTHSEPSAKQEARALPHPGQSKHRKRKRKAPEVEADTQETCSDPINSADNQHTGPTSVSDASNVIHASRPPNSRTRKHVSVEQPEHSTPSADAGLGAAAGDADTSNATPSGAASKEPAGALGNAEATDEGLGQLPGAVHHPQEPAEGQEGTTQVTHCNSADWCMTVICFALKAFSIGNVSKGMS